LITWNILKKNPRRSTKDKDGNIITHYSQKDKAAPKKVTLPIDKEMLNNLAEYIREYQIRPADPLFPFSRQRAWQIIINLGHIAAEKNPDLFHTEAKPYIIKRKIVYKNLVIIGRKGIHTHNLRHSAAVFLAKKCKNPEDVRKLQMILQHSNILMTQEYLKYASSESRELIDSAFASPTKN
jgi:integrase